MRSILPLFAHQYNQMRYRIIINIMITTVLLISSLYANKNLEDEGRERNSDLGYLNIPDTTEVYNLLDTIAVQIGENDTANLLIKEKSLKDNLLALVYGAIFRDTTNHNNSLHTDLIESEKRFRIHEDKTIVNIYLKKIPVFGGSVNDSLLLKISEIEKFGNSLHANTNDWVIFNNLLFREGDAVQAFRLADNERILRQLPFIRDVRIIIIPRSEDDQVDILILTRDVFSIGTSLNINDEKDFAVAVYDRNLFGNGWEFRNTFRHRSNRNPTLGYEGIFDIRNIRGSFISATLGYQHAYDMEQGRLLFSKEYLTQETLYAGGLDLIQTSLNDGLNDYQRVLYESNIFDLWAGRAFIIGDIENRNNFKLGLRYFYKTFDERPQVRADSNFFYHEQKQYLGNIIFNRLEYLTSNMILGFGQTEDIPEGYALEITGGFSDGEYKDRLYSGMQFWAASWFDQFGYLAITTQVASYLNHRKAEDGLLGFRFTYFTPLMDLGDYKFRHFFYTNYLTGFNRIDDRLIDIQDKNGIRGLSHSGLLGKERLVLTLESRAFAPWTLIGFRFSFLSFADVGFVSDGHNLLNEKNLSSAFGLGCQIRNEGLALQTINLRFAYYPKTPEDVSHFGFEISLSDPLFFSQQRLGKPRIFVFE